MPDIAEGTVKKVESGVIVFAPTGTNYELHLQSNAPLSAESPAKGTINLKARKIWTIPAGGNFIQPLFGQPRVVQGMIKTVAGNKLTVQAGTPVTVEIPPEKSALDLKNGNLVPGAMVNITVCPGATFDLVNG